MPKTVTESELLQAKKITAEMAAAYLGGGLGPQSARLLARDGQIGCTIPGTNRVYFQPMKLIAFKHGDDVKYQAAARAFMDAGLGEVATKIAVAILKLSEEVA